MSQYKILFKDDNLCFIALNTVYSIGEIMKDFVEKEIKNSNYNGIIIFDSLLSSLSYNDSIVSFALNVITVMLIIVKEL